MWGVLLCVTQLLKLKAPFRRRQQLRKKIEKKREKEKESDYSIINCSFLV
jgi:hypothetical protein